MKNINLLCFILSIFFGLMVTHTPIQLLVNNINKKVQFLINLHISTSDFCLDILLMKYYILHVLLQMKHHVTLYKEMFHVINHME